MSQLLAFFCGVAAMFAIGFGVQELLILVLLGAFLLLPVGLVVGLVLLLKRRPPTPPPRSHCPHCPHCGKPLGG